jgi:hypothetical protein
MHSSPAVIYPPDVLVTEQHQQNHGSWVLRFFEGLLRSRKQIFFEG